MQYTDVVTWSWSDQKQLEDFGLEHYFFLENFLLPIPFIWRPDASSAKKNPYKAFPSHIRFTMATSTSSDDSAEPLNKRQLLYWVTCPYTSLVKIGYWSGPIRALRARYATYYGAELEFVVYSCDFGKAPAIEKAIQEWLSKFHHHLAFLQV